jgi:hypothetical protein
MYFPEEDNEAVEKLQPSLVNQYLPRISPSYVNSGSLFYLEKHFRAFSARRI